MSPSSRPRIPCAVLLLWPLFVAVPIAVPTAARSESLDAWMPDDVIGYVRVSGLGAQVDRFLASDLRKELESLPMAQELLSHPNWKKFLKEVENFETSTGQSALSVFQGLLGEEVLVGARIGLGGPEVILIARAPGEKELEKSLQLIKNAAEQRGVFAEYKSRQRGDWTVESVQDKLAHVRIGSVWAASNSSAAIDRVLDLVEGKSTSSLQNAAAFSRARQDTLKDALISAAVRPQFIPNYAIPEKVDNPLGSLIAGAWTAALDAADLLCASARVSGGDLEVKLASVLGKKADDQKDWKKYAGFFPEVFPDGFKERLEKKGVLAYTQVQRNLAKWWERREDLLTSKAAGGLIEFSNVMSIVFGGRNFQDEVLPDLGPTVTIVARNQEYKSLAARPQPAIPGFAGIFQLKNAKDSSEGIVAAFYTLVGIINADRAQKKGGMSMIPRPKKVGDVDLHTVSFGSAMTKDSRPGLLHNFTPSLAVVGSKVIISSSEELAQVIVEALQGLEEPTKASGAARDSLAVDGAALRSILKTNRDVLVEDNMLKRGHSKVEAEQEIGLLFDALQHLRDLRLESGRKGNVMELELKVSTDLDTKAASQSAPAGAKAEKAVKL